ncbi:MAG: phospholipase [Aquabacterium sp.]|uniref:phospholipase D-like domain-containing protein n=1 Tax=Aquabacterium sp. TaxID=1872578 RepID=UPI0025BC3F20|nr:phospholipase D-like domain-containing protein [Aquabacterium sp.]MBI5925492.1 phospholipase [Aquabacterium sp.]
MPPTVTIKTPVLRSQMAVTATSPWFVKDSEYQPHDGSFKLLINGQEAFGAVHNAIANAQKSVCIICWGFQPSMYFIRDGASPSIGELLEQKAAKGVQVRILSWALKPGLLNVTGFSESNTPGRWDSGIKDMPETSTRKQYKYDRWWYNEYDEEQEWSDEVAKDLRALFGNKKSQNLHFYGRGFSGADRVLIRSKGYDDTGLSWTTKAALASAPTHHQKMVLIDYEDKDLATGFVMGHNMLDAYWDTSEHSSFPRSFLRTGTPDSEPNKHANGKVPRHDFSSQITGPLIGDLFNNFAVAWKEAKGEKLKSANFASYPYRETDALRYIKGQLLRTQPQYGKEDIKKCYLQAVNNATQYIHIENQYFRWPPLAEKIKAAAQGQGAGGRKPETHGSLYLFVITNSKDEGVGPGATNTYRMMDALGRADTMPQVARKQNLDTLEPQLDSARKEVGRLEREKSALDSEARLYQGLPNTPDALTKRYQSINVQLEPARMKLAELEAQNAALKSEYNTQRKALKKSDEQPEDSRWEEDTGGATIQPKNIPGLKCHVCTLVAPDTLAGEPWVEVYIHAKLMLIDDAFMTLGSANINTRSMQTDSELNIAHHRPEITVATRKALWESHTHGRCGNESMGLNGMSIAYKTWGDILTQNAAQKNKRRKPIAQVVAFVRLSDDRANKD